MSIFPYVTVRDYVTDFAGNSDSTVAIQKAIDESVHHRLPLFVPAGLYRVSTLYARNGLVMTGAHPGGYGVPVETHTRLGLIAGTNASMFVGKPNAAHVRLSRMHFDGNKNNNQKGNIIDIEAVVVPVEAQWHIDDCFIDAAPEHGVYIGYGRRAVKVSDCTINYNGQNGIRVNASDSHIDRCIIGSNRAHGIGVGGAVTNIESCDIYGNEQDGICVYSTIQMVGIHHNRIDRNKRHAITVSGRNKAITITGNIFHSNAKTDLNIGADCRVEQAANVQGTD